MSLLPDANAVTPQGLRAKHLWECAKEVARIAHELARLYTRQLLRIADGNTAILPPDVQDGICSACHVPLVPDATMKPRGILRHDSKRVVRMLGKDTTKTSFADESYECLACGNKGRVPILQRTQRKKRRREDLSASKLKPVLPPPQLPQPTPEPGMRTLGSTAGPPVPSAGSSVSLFAMKSLLKPTAPQPAQASLPSYMITSKEAPKPKTGNSASGKSDSKGQKAGKGRPGTKFADKIKQELDAASNTPQMKFFM